MNLQRAIEIGTIYRKQFHPNTDFNYAQAITLLIKAGERLVGNRNHTIGVTNRLLPSETEE